MNLADIEFDHDVEFIKHRKLGEGVTYEQDGVLFSSGFVPLKVLVQKASTDRFDDMSPAELRTSLRHNDAMSQGTKKAGTSLSEEPGKKVHSARQRADDKLAGFRTPDQPDYIEKALSENHAAIMAQEHAE